MPGLSFTLPHWLYWVGLLVFPLIAMALAKRPRPAERRYSTMLGYLILITGGIIGLHRFYLKSLWGLVFIPIFLVVLFGNSQEHDAREVFSEAHNVERAAQRSIERYQDRVSQNEKALPGLRTELEEAEDGSFAQRAAERRIERAEDTITSGKERLAEAQADLEEAKPRAAAALSNREFWASVSEYAFYTILALLLIDALLMPRLVRRANENIVEHHSEAEAALKAAGQGPERAEDSRLVENWIDRLSLFCGEFVSYWAVIAVFVYYYEVIARYVFNSPTNWAHESMYLMFGMQYLIAGAYAMLTESHVRVDVFYAPMTRKNKAWVDLLTSVFFFIFAFTLLFTSWIFAMDAIAVPSGNALISDWARGEIPFSQVVANWNLAQWTSPDIRWGEISFNEWEVPLWPMKWVMVLGAILLVLQGFSKFAKDIRAIARGE